MVGPLTLKPGETTADFKLRIEQAQKEAAAKPVAPPLAPEAQKPPEAAPPVPQPKPAIVASEPSAQPPVAPAPPAAAATPTPAAPPKADDKVDPLEWARKKGLKSPEDIARSLRSLETEFHRRNQMPPVVAPPTPAYEPRPAAPPYQPQPGGGYPPPYQPAPRYAPPAPVPLRRDQVQWLAETYQIDPADAERLAPLVMDMVSASQRQSDQRFQRLERDNARNSEMFRLMQDPSFQHPEVQFELHRILEEDPRIFELEPAPYTIAFNRALMNIARRLVTTGKEDVLASDAVVSSRPPTTLGSDGGSGGRAPAPAPLSSESFNGLSLDKKREMLTSIGARTAS